MNRVGSQRHKKKITSVTGKKCVTENITERTVLFHTQIKNQVIHSVQESLLFLGKHFVWFFIHFTFASNHVLTSGGCK